MARRKIKRIKRKYGKKTCKAFARKLSDCRWGRRKKRRMGKKK